MAGKDKSLASTVNASLGGYFTEHPGFAEEIVREFARGTKMNIDLTDKWDFWAVMDQPVEQLRARYGILPAEA